MTRLPNLRKGELDDERLAVWEVVVRTTGGERLNEGGGLVGPFNALVYAPKIGGPLQELGHVFHHETSLSMEWIELVILTVAAHWKAEFEWWAHRPRARESGIPDAVIEAIGAAQAPEFERDDERTIYTLVHHLIETGRIDDATYAAAERIVGHAGLVELLALCGYYTLIAFILNGFNVQLPLGEVKRWQ